MFMKLCIQSYYNLNRKIEYNELVT